MKPQPELVGQEAVAAEPVHGQILFESFHEVLSLPATQIVFAQIFGREIPSVGEHITPIQSQIRHFHLGNHTPGMLPAVGLIEEFRAS
jgi:hypothetical protein